MENNDRFWRKGAEVWIDEVILDEKSFFFIYDKLSDIEMDDLSNTVRIIILIGRLPQILKWSKQWSN